jgi:hypothetical protein
MSKNVSCRISGKTFTFTDSYYSKRVEEYVDSESIQRYFVTKKVKQLIQRGYNVQEIRNILSVNEKGLLPVDSQEIKDIIIFHMLRETTTCTKKSNNFATHKSDDDVVVFINNIKDLNYDKEIYSADR